MVDARRVPVVGGWCRAESRQEHRRVRDSHLLARKSVVDVGDVCHCGASHRGCGGCAIHPGRPARGSGGIAVACGGGGRRVGPDPLSVGTDVGPLSRWEPRVGAVAASVAVAAVVAGEATASLAVAASAWVFATAAAAVAARAVSAVAFAAAAAAAVARAAAVRRPGSAVRAGQSPARSPGVTGGTSGSAWGCQRDRQPHPSSGGDGRARGIYPGQHFGCRRCSDPT